MITRLSRCIGGCGGLAVAMHLGHFSLHAQATLGTLNGTVVDSSGAAIPGATVMILSAQTDLQRTTTSQQNGFFQLFNLPVGTYNVKVTHEGFDTTELPAIEVQ